MSKAGAVVLLSGGLDSAVSLAIAVERGFRPAALSFDYGQRHRWELQCAGQQAEKQGASHLCVKIDDRLFRGSALIGTELDVPLGRTIDESIPVTYVPARNLLFLAHAVAFAESHGIETIFLGVNVLDYSGYPDCRPAFLAAFEEAARLGTRHGVEGGAIALQAPLIEMDKAAIIRRGFELNVDFAATSSCYQPAEDGRPCRQCDSGQLRARGFRETRRDDPLLQRFGFSISRSDD